MGKQIDKSNLGYLDLNFQYKLVKYFIENSRFFEGILSIVDPNAFTDSLLRTIVGTVKDYYLKNGIVPSYDILSILLREKAKTQIEIEEWDALITKLKTETGYEGFSDVTDIALKFFKQQNLIRVANKIIEIAKNGDIERYDECQKIFNDAILVDQSDDFGHNIFDLEEKALSSDYTVSIPTGIDKLDEVLGGGLDKGKLGLIIAAAGFGKTTFTTAVDAYAATCRCEANNFEGYKVLQIYFEDEDVDIARKHYSKITSTEARMLKRLNDDEREGIAEMLDNHPDRETIMKNLRLKRFRTGEVTATDIGLFIKRLINAGFKPDLVSIDYFECIAAEKGGYQTDTEWTREGVTMRKLENLAHELDIAIWVPTQGTKDSMDSPEGVKMNQASGSAKKVHVAQLIISIARGIGDIDRNRAVVSILKNRSGKAGKVFNNVYFDNGTCTISCSDTQEYDEVAWEDEARRIAEEARIRSIRAVAERQRREVSDTEEQGQKRKKRVGNFVGPV